MERICADDRAANSSGRDDLTHIARLGQDIARRLDEAGIRTYAELADCSVGDIAKALPSASPLLWGCIDGWRHRAQELAPVAPLDAEPHPESVPESVAEPGAASQVRPISHPSPQRAPTTPSPSAQAEASQAAAESADASPPGLLAPIVRLRPDRTLLRAAQPFGVTLSLDLTKVAP